MDLTLSHHFDAPIDTVWTMLHDPQSHITKFESMGHREIEVVEQSVTDDSMDLTLKRIVEIDVPSVAKKFLTPTNEVTSTDHWQRDDETTCSGHYTADIKGVPADTKGETHLAADDDGAGCTYTVNLHVKVKVPLIGEKVAGALKPQLQKQVEAEFAAGDAWLAAH